VCATPPVPTGLEIHPRTNTSVRLDWTDQDGEDQYWIERSPDGTNGWWQIGTVLRDVTSFIDNGLSQGGTYFYRLRAKNDTGISDYSNVKSGHGYLFEIFLPFLENK